MRAIGYFFLFVLLFIANSTFSQTEEHITLSGGIKEDSVLRKGKYHIASNLIVYNNAYLSVEAGTELLFSSGAEIIVYGGLNLNGGANNFITLKSIDTKDEGIGISIKGSNSQKKVRINYSKFSHLIRPLNFEVGWVRDNIEVLNNQFNNINTFESAVLIKKPGASDSSKSPYFHFKRNSFFDNKANIVVEGLFAGNTKYIFNNNLFQNNLFYNNYSHFSENAFVGKNDSKIINEETIEKFVEIKDNTFINNYRLNEDGDSIIGYANIGFTGFNNQISFPKNHFYNYDSNTTQIGDFYFDFEDDYYSPVVLFTPTLKSNSAVNIYSAYNNFETNTSANDNEFTINFLGNALAETQNPKFLVVYFDTLQMLEKKIDTVAFEIKKTQNSVLLTRKGNNPLPQPNYIKISKFNDELGFNAPAVILGQMPYLKAIKTLKNKKQKIIISSNKLLDTTNYENNKNYYLKTPWKKSYSIGAFGGVSNYFGDLKGNSQFDFDNSHIAYGIRFQYNYTPYVSFYSGINYSNISGEDATAQSDLKKLRALSFSSVIYDLNFGIHLNLIKNRERNRLIPYVGAGINLFYFNPTKSINGMVYELNKIGTEGQNDDGNTRYRLLQAGIPLVIGLDTKISEKISIGFEITVVKTFTDYLDDVSTVYVDNNTVAQSNPDIPIDVIEQLTGTTPSNIGIRRGNANRKDWYMFSGFSVKYNF